MAFNANTSDKKVVGGGLYTGVANAKIQMINPTKAELEAKGLNPQSDPIYLTTDNNGISKVLINLYMIIESAKIYPKRAFWIENKVRKNKENTKTEWINKFGNTAWSDSETTPPNYTWFKTDGARPALIGEGKLTKFIKAWANVDLVSQATLDNPTALAKGDISEIKALFAIIPNNEVQVLLGVRATDKGNYQDVYDGHFDRANNKDYSKWKKELEKDGNEYKSDYQGDLNFKPFTGSSIVAQDAPTDLNVPANSIFTDSNTNGGAPNAIPKF